jgi:hypothetical protein
MMDNDVKLMMHDGELREAFMLARARGSTLPGEAQETPFAIIASTVKNMKSVPDSGDDAADEKYAILGSAWFTELWDLMKKAAVLSSGDRFTIRMKRRDVESTFPVSTLPPVLRTIAGFTKKMREEINEAFINTMIIEMDKDRINITGDKAEVIASVDAASEIVIKAENIILSLDKKSREMVMSVQSSVIPPVVKRLVIERLHPILEREIASLKEKYRVLSSKIFNSRTRGKSFYTSAPLLLHLGNLIAALKANMGGIPIALIPHYFGSKSIQHATPYLKNFVKITDGKVTWNT